MYVSSHSINETFQSYLGFSWKIDGKVRHFVFTVLPFGLNSVPFLFTKIFRPLVKHWRKQTSYKDSVFLGR